MPASGRAAYLADPNRCLHCNAAIPLLAHQRPYQIRQKKFCNSSCAASYNNTHYSREGKKRRPPKVRTCKSCRGAVNADTPTRRMLCDACAAAHQDRLLGRPKHLCRNNDINNHARYVMRDHPKVCQVCGYSAHADVCHIRAISDFPDNAPVSQINHPANLVYLCPNHHWEFDHGLLDPETRKGRD